MKIDVYFLAAFTQVLAWMGLLFGLTKLDFFHTPFRVCAIFHGKSTISRAYASANDVDPGGDDCGQTFQ
jgi:hypothetical protein